MMKRDRKAKVIFIGDAIKGNMALWLKADECSNAKTPYTLPEGATIEIRFPAADSSVSVVLSTATGSEITVTGVNTFSYLGSSAKSLLLNPSDDPQPVDVIVTDAQSNPTTFEDCCAVLIKNRANPPAAS